jgi:hypothetical protein
MEKKFIRSFHEKPLKWNDALIFITGFSYVGAAISTIIGYPPQDTMYISAQLQVVMYIFCFFLLAFTRFYKPLRWFLAGLYGMMAMWSFNGIQRWKNYVNPSTNLGVAMAAWDIILAIALLGYTNE